MNEQCSCRFVALCFVYPNFFKQSTRFAARGMNNVTADLLLSALLCLSNFFQPEGYISTAMKDVVKLLFVTV